MKIGKRLKFNFDKSTEFVVKEIIEKVHLPLSWEWHKGHCPHCSKKIAVNKEYFIDKLVVLEGDHEGVVYLGYTEELVNGQPLTLRLPDHEFCKEKDMSEEIRGKSKYMKEKKDKENL